MTALNKLISTASDSVDPSRRQRQRSRPLRIALYGRQEAGKTCYLAALAMTRVSNPRAYTCDWLYSPEFCPVPPPGAEEGEQWERWLRSLPDVESQFARGKKWLNEAKAALGRGDLPDPNRNTSVYRYRFVFRGTEYSSPNAQSANGSPQQASVGRNYQIELVDYSGELVNPDLEEKELVKKVRDHLRESDGLIILAEAPKLNGSQIIQSEGIARLRVAFEGIRADKWDAGDLCPVALVINKSDRLIACNEYDPKKAERVIEEFMDWKPEPPQRQFRDLLLTAVGPSNSRTFIASAFGKSTIALAIKENGAAVEQERPLIDGRLNSFGLEDPFMWLARQRESLLVDRLANHVAGMAPWKVWQLANRSFPRFMAAADATKSLMKESTSRKESIQCILNASYKMLAKQIVSAVALCLSVLVALIVGFTTASDNLSFNAYKPLPTSIVYPAADTSIETMQTAKSWFARYEQFSWTRLLSYAFICSRSSSKERIVALDERLELENLRKLIEAAETTPTMHEASKALDVFEHDHNNLSVHGIAVLGMIRNTKDKQQAKVDGNDEDAKAQNEINTALDSGNFIEAARELTAVRPGCSELVKLFVEEKKKAFANQFASSLESKVNDLVAKSDFSNAYDLAKLVPENDSIKKLIDEVKLAQLKTSLLTFVKRANERFYYEAVRHTPSLEAIDNYRSAKCPKEVHNQFVERRVDAYAAWLAKVAKDESYALDLVSIDWQNTKTDYWTSLSVRIDGNLVITTRPVLSKMQGTFKFPNADSLGTVRGTLVKSVVIRVDSESVNNGYFFNGPWCSATETHTFRELAAEDGISISMTGEKNQKVVLRLSNFPPEPILPPYSTLIEQSGLISFGQ